jgi:Flp pilus assembly protein TadB
MSLLVTAALWAGAGVGCVIVLASLTGRSLFDGSGIPRRRGPTGGRSLLRIATVAVAAFVVLALSGWLAAGVLAGAAVAALPRVLGGKAAREAAIARTEAIASWTEMIRDSIVAASGLEEAIISTGPVAPIPIGPEVRALVRRLDHLTLPDALVAFGRDVRHPSADLVVAAFVIAARMEVSDLSGLLSRLADAIRDDARMRVRVEVSRTQVRTSAKVIVGVVAATIVLLAATSRDYLTVYDEPGGQAMLLVAGGIFALGAWLLDRMATVDAPERFNARTDASVLGGPSPW